MLASSSVGYVADYVKPPEGVLYAPLRIPTAEAFYEAPRLETLDELIDRKIQEYGVSPTTTREIIKRESGYNPKVCNFTYGCASGQGLMQIIPSTERDCEKRLSRELDMFTAEDNLDCGLTLLKEDGVGHWNPYSGPY